MNKFTINDKEYFLKLIPDLSVFDIIEKYHIENNKEDGIDEDKLYFYFNGINDKVHNISIPTEEDGFLEYVKSQVPHSNDCLISVKIKDLKDNDKAGISIECTTHGEQKIKKYSAQNVVIPFKRFILKTNDNNAINAPEDSIIYNFSINDFSYYVFISNSGGFNISPDPENLYIGVCF